MEIQSLYSKKVAPLLLSFKQREVFLDSFLPYNVLIS